MAARANILTKIVLLFALLNISACVSSSSQRYALKTKNFGFNESSAITSQFDLRIFTNSLFHSSNKNQLNIYLEGDGSPYIRNQYIASDPTSYKGLMLQLMSVDGSPSILLGRPCYHHNTVTRGCDDNKWWTSHRYSEDVVNSMTTAIESLASEYEHLSLIGFSGGGSLAMLIGAQLENTNEIITINANLDIDAWVQQHGYAALYGSVNPVEILPLLADIKQRHLIGGRDTNVDSSLWQGPVKHYKNAEIIPYPSFNHYCCWSSMWKNFINEVKDIK